MIALELFNEKNDKQILNLNFWDFENPTLNKSFLANMVYVYIVFVWR